MTTRNVENLIVYQRLERTNYERFEDSAGILRYEVREGASFYIRLAELNSGIDIARINTIYIRNFPYLDELRAYIEREAVPTE